MRQDKRRRIVKHLLPIAELDSKWEEYGFFPFNEKIEDKMFDKTNRWELIYFRFDTLLDFYYHELKGDPLNRNLIMVDVSNYLKQLKEIEDENNRETTV